MTAYATIQDVQSRMQRTMSTAEAGVCNTMLQDAAVIIDSYNENADADAKKVVSCRLVIRALGDGETGGIPMGATQGTQSALGYSQSWTIASGGAAGEMYLGKLEKKMLGVSDKLGSRSPVEALVRRPPECGE